MTFPLAVFLKNLRCVIVASERGRLRIVISTIVSEEWKQNLSRERESQEELRELESIMIFPYITAAGDSRKRS